MRITGPQRTNGTSAGAAARKAGSGSGFSLPDVGGAVSPGAATGARAMTDVSSLLALQTVAAPEPATVRRGRMVKRGRRLLDILDDVKVSLLDGSCDALTLEKLESAIVEAREQTDDSGLEAVLDAVELRARVELAKLQRMAGR